LQLFCKLRKALEKHRAAFARRRSGVRIPSAPLVDPAYLWAIRGKRKAPGVKTRGCYTNYYTNALRKRLFHRRDGAILHVG
jgi:hypothetical protein